MTPRLLCWFKFRAHDWQMFVLQGPRSFLVNFQCGRCGALTIGKFCNGRLDATIWRAGEGRASS